MWILTFVILFNPSMNTSMNTGQVPSPVAATTVSQEYSSPEKCNAALQAMRERLNARGGVMLATCTAK